MPTTWKRTRSRVVWRPQHHASRRRRSTGVLSTGVPLALCHYSRHLLVRLPKLNSAFTCWELPQAVWRCINARTHPRLEKDASFPPRMPLGVTGRNLELQTLLTLPPALSSDRLQCSNPNLQVCFTCLDSLGTGTSEKAHRQPQLC